ncbi:MAG: hypothetical protein ACI9P5_003206 [Saprospiraceae bacterium]|jgi:hypothetical protein
MTFYTASFDTVVLRFTLMMAAVIVPFFIGIPILAIISLPIFLSAMTAVSFFPPKQNAKILAITEGVLKTEAA